jgi:hypothetical protein
MIDFWMYASLVQGGMASGFSLYAEQINGLLQIFQLLFLCRIFCLLKSPYKR